MITRPNTPRRPKQGGADDEVLARVIRSGFVESVHRGSLAITNPDGSLLLHRGDPWSPVLPRSSNKPLQAHAMLEAGLTLHPRLLALVCASHSGEPTHRAGVLEILKQFKLSEADLQNVPDYPVDDEERNQWIRNENEPSRIAQNCSGKHAGMLATCIVNGWDTKTYLNPQHPLQQFIERSLGKIASEPVSAVATDGCGAPVMALSLGALAAAFGRLAQGSTSTTSAIATAIRDYPVMVGGTNRDVTQLLLGTPGLVAKDGAEAVYAAGLPDGRGLALKISDGGQRARPVVMAAMLRRLGIESNALDKLELSPVLGHGVPVGAVSAVNITDD